MNKTTLLLTLTLTLSVITGCKSSNPSDDEINLIGSEAGEQREFTIAPDTSMIFRWCPPGKYKQTTFNQGFWISEHNLTPDQWSTLTGKEYPLAFRPPRQYRPVLKINKPRALQPGEQKTLAHVQWPRLKKEHETRLQQWMEAEPSQFHDCPDGPELRTAKEIVESDRPLGYDDIEAYKGSTVTDYASMDSYYGRGINPSLQPRFYNKDDSYGTTSDGKIDYAKITDRIIRAETLHETARWLNEQAPELFDYYVIDEAGQIPNFNWAGWLPDFSRYRTQEERQDTIEKLKSFPADLNTYPSLVQQNGDLPKGLNARSPSGNQILYAQNLNLLQPGSHRLLIILIAE